MMRARIGWLLSWSCYWAGDVVCRLGHRLPDWAAPAWYPAYQRLMGWSSDLQDACGRGPWTPVEELPDD